MKAIQFLPLAYLADVHGFIYFVPYMLFIMAIAQTLAASRRRARRATLATASSTIAVPTAGQAVLAVYG